MKKHLIILCACVVALTATAQTNPYSDKNEPDLQMSEQIFFDPNAKKEEPYQFRTEYRIEGGYVQHWQHSKNKSAIDMYLHGARIGMTFDFLLPNHFSLQTGLLYTIAHGTAPQKWGVVDEEESYATSDSLTHRVTEHWLAIPIRAYYNIKLWKQLNLFFYGGPQLMIGLAETDHIKNELPDKATAFYRDELGLHVDPYNRFKDELYPVNIQLGIGGGLEWDCFRLQAGYDFGLNNQLRQRKTENQHLWEWSWYVSFAYKLPL